MPELVSTALVAKDEPGTIRFAVYDWHRTAYEDLVEAFEKANHGLHVQLVSLDEIESAGPMEWPDWVVHLVSAADVVEMWASPEMARLGLVRDLTPFIEAELDFQSDDFYHGILEGYQWDGGTWALPLAIDFELICYNKEAFYEAGVTYPEPGWTWDDFLAKARALTVREGDKVVHWGFALPPPVDPRPFIEGRAGPLVDTVSDPPTPRFDQAEVIEAVRWYTNLLKEEVMILPEMREGPDGTMEWDSRMLYDGQLAAMWVDDFSSWQWARESGRVGIVPFPVDAPDARTTPVQTRSDIVMSVGTRQPDVAWRWMDFLSRRATSGRGIQSLPSRRSVAGMSGFWDRLNEESAATLRYAVDHGYTIRQGPEYSAVYVTLHRALDAIIGREKSVEKALADAQVQAVADIPKMLTYLAELTPVPPFAVSPEGQGVAGEKVTTITFIPVLGSLGTQRYRDLARQFHEIYPDVLVEVKAAPFGDPHDLQGLAHAADCFLGYPNFPDPENRAVILDLAPLLDADPAFTTDDFYLPVLEQFTWQGQLWGLPVEVEPYVVEYNKDLFDAAGLDYPALEWTPDDFLARSVALTLGEEESKQYGFVSEVYEGNALPLILERLGARLIDENVTPPDISFDDPTSVEAMRWYADLSTVYDVRPVFITDPAELMEDTSSYVEREAMISEGQAAMWSSHGSADTFDDHSGLNIGVAPLPMGPGGTGSYLSTQGYFISAQTEARQACWRWISFLTGQPRAVDGLPVRRSVAESEAYRQQVGDERAAAYRASVAGQGPFQVFSEEPWLRGATYLLFRAYGRVLEGEVGVEAALNTAQGKADEYRTCVIARDAFYHQEEWQVCLKEVDPTLPDSLFGEEE